MTARRRLPTVGFALILLVATVLSTVATARAASTSRRAAYRDAAQIAAGRLDSRVERDLVEIERISTIATNPVSFRRTAQTRIDSLPELRAVALTRRDGHRLIVADSVPVDLGPFVVGDDLAADPELAIVVSRVLDEADASAGTPFDLDGRRMMLVGAPQLPNPNAAEAARRASVTGAVFGIIDGQALLESVWPGHAQLVAPDGRAINRTIKGDVFDAPLDIRGRAWTLRLDQPRESLPSSAVAVLLAGLAITAGLTALFDAEMRRRRRAEEQASSRLRQLERIAESGARLQQTLDLAELLPAFAVGLATDFDLRGVSISVRDAEGELTEAFATGEPGESPDLELPLRRGWRAVGVLAVRTGRPLDESEHTSLQALADLLAVAMSNAQLYEREQLNAARLRDLDALKNAFLGTVSHELRTSMTAIMGFGELLSDSWDNLDEDRRREMANRIRRSAGSLRHLVDDLLDFARLEQERLRVSPRTVDLAGIVRQTVDGLTPLLGQHELVLDIDDECRAWADPVAIERILANLVSNASKYAPIGTTVTITCHAIDGVARLVVADQGPGIPPEERKRIFARFYRLDTPEAVRTRGAGIGLSILRDFADRSGATVVVDEAPGGGARFTIDFPVEPINTEMEGPVAVTG
ncbi:MAG: two-component system, OmpR family, phosphate regulon sensor histidine kinase PhoR [Actinomycetota bacterium]